MWQSDGQLIQIEVGAGIVKAFTEPDRRNLIEQLFEEPPEEGKGFITLTKSLRQNLQTEGIYLPPIGYRDDPNLQSNGVRAYFGLELYQFNMQHAQDLSNFIVQKAREYNTIAVNKVSLEPLILDCLEDVRQGHFQQAFVAYSIIYYQSLLQGYELGIIRSLSDAGSILLASGDLQRAQMLFLRASLLSNNPSLVDPILKLQVSFNLAETSKNLGMINQALNSYGEAAKIAFYSGNFSQLFIILVNIGHSYYLLQKYSEAIFALEQADELLIKEEKPDYQISRNIQKTISEIKDIILLQQAQKVKELNERLKNENINLFFKTIFVQAFSLFAQSAIQAFVCKSLGIKGNGGFAIFGKFDCKGSTFIKSQFGNSNTMNNLKMIINK
jgi:hypothetical protein